MERHFGELKIEIKNTTEKDSLKKKVELALSLSTYETEFKQNLLQHGINTVVRRNDTGRIYGMTFIDHESRTVWNGSQLDKKPNGKCL